MMAGSRRGALAAVVAVAGVMCAPAQARAQDACPNGWSIDVAVEFAPPVPAVDARVGNPERADGCTLLDRVCGAKGC